MNGAATVRPNWPRLMLAATALLVVGIRLRLLAIPLERDEGEYAYAGQLLLQGVPPYQLCYNMKLPGTYGAYAALMAIFGQTPTGIHLGLLLVNLAAAALLWLIARRFLDERGAAVAAGSYLLLTVSPAMLGLAAHATQFVMAMALLGLWLLCKAHEQGRGRWWFWSGWFFGLAFLMKQPGAMFGMFGLTTLLWAGWQDRANWPLHAKRLGWYAAGGLTPVIATGLALWACGVFERFWFWTTTYARVYASQATLADGWAALKEYGAYMVQCGDAPMWIIAGGGLVAVAAGKRFSKQKPLLIAFLIFSAIAVSGGLNFREHYFVMLAPALSLLIGAAVDRAAGQWGAPSAMTGFAIACVALLFGNRLDFFELSPAQACRDIYSGNPFVEASEVGHYIRDHSQPGDRIAILGSEPEIIFYSRRQSASGYIYMYDFVVNQPYAAAMRKEFVKQVTDAKPEYVVVVRNVTSWTGQDLSRSREAMEIFGALGPVMNPVYKVVGQVADWPESAYYWDADLAHAPPLKGGGMVVFRRKK